MARSYLVLMFADRGKLEEGGTHGSVRFADGTLTVFEGCDGFFGDAPGRLWRASSQIMMFRDDLGHTATAPVNH